MHMVAAGAGRENPFVHMLEAGRESLLVGRALYVVPVSTPPGSFSIYVLYVYVARLVRTATGFNTRATPQFVRQH